ncbi:MAG: hypothetical protein K0R18_1676 [Bacillales bacterium]|jgi:hypothetical protein|nr:hypothetical protein [Bacillales bacterium]
MDNMSHYNKLKTVPKDALKEISFGKLKGKSDINPQYRYEAMTNEFGVCGIGWKYEIVNSWTQEANAEQIMLFVQINLYIKDGEKWGEPIPAIGGDFLIEKDKNGLHGNDEAYKMATTDALGVCMKMLGVAADVYRGLANDTKYGREKPQFDSKQQNKQPNTNTLPQVNKQSQQENKAITKPTHQQLIELGKKATDLAINPDDIKKIMEWKFKIKTSSELTIEMYNILFKDLDKLWESYVASQSK